MSFLWKNSVGFIVGIFKNMAQAKLQRMNMDTAGELLEEEHHIAGQKIGIERLSIAHFRQAGNFQSIQACIAFGKTAPVCFMGFLP